MKKSNSVIAQVRTALSNPVALVIGILLGGFVPLTTYTVSHVEARSVINWILIAGGLTYSAKTVYEWARMAFNSPAKALGFVLLLEGVMVTSTVEWVRIAALVYLISINAVATGCTLALADITTTKKRAVKANKKSTPANDTVRVRRAA